jgi:hypothetical protein
MKKKNESREDEDVLFAAYVPEGADEAAERLGDLCAARLGVGGVSVGAQQRDRQPDPPHGRDQEGDQHGRRLADAEALVEQHDDEGEDERDAAADVAERVAE